MGFGSISPGSLILIILIILLLFGSSTLKNIGKDLADAIKNFQKGMKNEKKGDIKNKIEQDEKKNGD